MAKKAKLSTEQEGKIKNKMLEFRLEAEDGNKPAFKRMTENERFKIGKQWNEDDITANEANGKFSLSINEILPIILDIAGTQEENPLDYKVRNVKGGTQVMAQILTSLTKNIMDNSMGREEGSRCFESGVTNARGFLYVDKVYNNDPVQGDLQIKEADPFMVLPDPTCKKYDYNADTGGAKYIWLDEWEDKGKMEAMYPDKELKSANYDQTSQGLWGRFTGIMSQMFGGGPSLYARDDYRHYDESNTPEEELNTNVTKQTNNYRVSNCFWKEWKKGAYVQRFDDPLNFLILTDPEDIKEAKRLAQDNENIRVIEKDNNENPLTVAVLNKTKMLGDILLEHIKDVYDGMNLYPIVRFAPYFDHGYEYPPTENLIGPQKLINYTFSSFVNIVKKLANTGWITGGGSQTKLEELEDHSGQDGIIINKKDYGGFIEKIEPTTPPVGLDLISERSKQNMREISQVQLQVPKTQRPESGIAKQVDEMRGARTKGIIFRNWNNTNILVARVIVELIRNNDIFSDDEIMAIIDDEDLLDAQILDQAKGVIINQVQQMGGTIPEQPQPPNTIRVRDASVEIQAQMLDTFQEQMVLYQKFIEQVEQAAIPLAKDIILKLLRKVQQGRYGIKVDTSPMAPTMRMMKRIETLELDKQLIEGGRPGISRKKLIEISDIPDKEEIIAEEVPVQGAA